VLLALLLKCGARVVVAVATVIAAAAPTALVVVEVDISQLH
jgi:hypothetical protein